MLPLLVISGSIFERLLVLVLSRGLPWVIVWILTLESAATLAGATVNKIVIEAQKLKVRLNLK